MTTHRPDDDLQRLQSLIGDDYRLQWIIGRGGMSTVWLADDLRHDREVAIKVLRPEYSDNPEFLDRFRNEARAAENISSDNVVATYDYREVPEPGGHTFCFIAMEYVRGETLADMLAREGSLDEPLALDVLEQAAHGLSIIHRMGLVHRDIKPGNLLITQNGQVKITDFGIAKAAAAVPLTQTGMVVGTVQYVSPEQAQGHDVTAASDIYSLGVVGYEMLAGRRPFGGDSSVSMALAHINDAPPALSTSISAPARELIGTALRKDPATRYADGNEFALAVSAVRFGERPPAPKSAAMARVAPEPSPTASTHMLGQVANPTTIHPAAIPQQSPAQRSAPQRSSSGGGKGFVIGLLVASLIAAGVVAALWLIDGRAGGGLRHSPETSTTTTEETTEEQTPEVVTEWVTPTPEERWTEQPRENTAPEPTTQQRPTPSASPTARPNPGRSNPGGGNSGTGNGQGGSDVNNGGGQPTNGDQTPGGLPTGQPAAPGFGLPDLVPPATNLNMGADRQDVGDAEAMIASQEGKA